MAKSIRVPGHWPNSIRLHPREPRKAFFTTTSHFGLVDLCEGNLVWSQARPFDESFPFLAVGSSGRYVATSDSKARVVLHAGDDGRYLRTIAPVHPVRTMPKALALKPDESALLFFSSAHGYVVSLPSGDIEATVDYVLNDLVSASFLGDDKIVAISQQKERMIWDLKRPNAKHTVDRFPGEKPEPLGHARIYDERLAMYPSSRSGFVSTLVDVATGEVLRTFVGHSKFVTDADLDASRKGAVTVSADVTARLWDVASGRETTSVFLTSADGTLVSGWSVASLPGGGFVAGLSTSELAVFTMDSQAPELCP